MFSYMMLLLNKANLSNRTASTLFFLLIVNMDVALDGVSGIRNNLSLHTLQVLHLLPTKFFDECT